jgi:hypothetical protein
MFFRPGADAVEGGVDSNEENFNLMIKCLLGQKVDLARMISTSTNVLLGQKRMQWRWVWTRMTRTLLSLSAGSSTGISWDRSLRGLPRLSLSVYWVCDALTHLLTVNELISVEFLKIFIKNLTYYFF